jgi:hypothetical protein
LREKKEETMSTFVYRDEYSVMGYDYDAEHGETEWEGYEPAHAKFLIARKNGTWSTVEVQIPFPMMHEWCTASHMVTWYSKVWGEPDSDVAYAFFLERY